MSSSLDETTDQQRTSCGQGVEGAGQLIKHDHYLDQVVQILQGQESHHRGHAGTDDQLPAQAFYSVIQALELALK